MGLAHERNQSPDYLMEISPPLTRGDEPTHHVLGRRPSRIRPAQRPGEQHPPAPHTHQHGAGEFFAFRRLP